MHTVADLTIGSLARNNRKSTIKSAKAVLAKIQFAVSIGQSEYPAAAPFGTRAVVSARITQKIVATEIVCFDQANGQQNEHTRTARPPNRGTYSFAIGSRAATIDASERPIPEQNIKWSRRTSCRIGTTALAGAQT